MNQKGKIGPSSIGQDSFQRLGGPTPLRFGENRLRRLDLHTQALKETFSHMAQALINETTGVRTYENGLLEADIPDLTHPQQLHHLKALAHPDAMTSEWAIDNGMAVELDGRPVRLVKDWGRVGLTKDQLNVFQTHVMVTETILGAYHRAISAKPKLWNVIAKAQGLESPERWPWEAPGALAKALESLSPSAGFTVMDTSGNVDGSTGNPIYNYMGGPVAGIFQYHPIVSAMGKDGAASIPWLQYSPEHVRTLGVLPERLHWLQETLEQGTLPIHPYTFSMIKGDGDPNHPVRSVRKTPAWVLMSKRSVMPLGDDYQLKLSFTGRITSEPRTIDWANAKEVLESTHILKQLAEKRLLPENVWFLPTLFAAQATQKGQEDERTTVLIRGGLQEAIGPGGKVGLPEDITPVTACTLHTRNLLTPGKTLFESLVETGWDPKTLVEDIVQSVSSLQLRLMALGFIPDAHTQNMAYLLDFKNKRFAGLLMKDVECDKVLPETLRAHGLTVHEDQLTPGVLRHRQGHRPEENIWSLYFHHTVISKHFVPLARLFDRLYKDRYGMDTRDVRSMVRGHIAKAIESVGPQALQTSLDMSGAFYDRNLAMKTFQVGPTPYYRVLPSHPLWPFPQN